MTDESESAMDVCHPCTIVRQVNWTQCAPVLGKRGTGAGERESVSVMCHHVRCCGRQIRPSV
eukprot:CAMPEP_0202405806 /NCGR_PEP_ID=MMETSP1128-20130828/7331_1 /ASSEMBLY_ACC=CAM_ASM_000463 /TAXON_ID=3047 /ORGANISM="Dunaliella tertiolecta, Strain CCMP1320" /LENGTH=61 /DNA_ID=CAMNT_0049010511 /DNA_START=64 /DNA_END=246 /DNA_ORIENTATION=-